VDDFASIIDRLQVWAWAGVAGMIGRVLYHSRQVQRGRRRFLSAQLIQEAPIALGMGFMAHGGCVWLGITGEPAVAAIILAGYLGPYSIDTIFLRWIERKIGPDQRG
jgi:hypothetical protein